MKKFTETHGGLYVGENLVLSPKSCWSVIQTKFFSTTFNPNAKTSSGMINSHMLNASNHLPFVSNIIGKELNGFDDWFIPSVEELQFFIKSYNSLPENYQPKLDSFCPFIFSSTEIDKFTFESLYFGVRNICILDVDRFLVMPFRYLACFETQYSICLPMPRIFLPNLFVKGIDQRISLRSIADKKTACTSFGLFLITKWSARFAR